MHAEHGHLQEVILQNFVPHRRYYGEEPADIATDVAERYWQTGLTLAPHAEAPTWATPITIEDMKRLIGEARRLMPDVGIQIPPNLADWWPELVQAGATDLGGLSSNGDHISPEHPFPSPHQVRKRLLEDGVALTERLCVYAKYIDADWVDQGVLDVIKTRFWSFIPRNGSGRTDAPQPIRRDLVAGAVAKGREGAELTPEELTALFAETRPEAIEDIRQAADELRAELAGDTVTFVVNRNINVSNVCIVGCAFCGFGQGKRSPDAYQHDDADFVARIDEAVEYGATELCIQSGIHPDWSFEDYLGYLRLAKRDRAAAAPARVLADGGLAHLRRLRPLADRGLRAAARGRARIDARDRRRGAPRRRAPAHLAEQAAGRPLGRGHRGVAPRGAAVDGDGDVRAHRGAVGARRAHARRALAAGPDGRLHGVRAAVVHPVPHAARAGPTGSRRSPARRTSSTRPCSGSRWARPSRRCRRPG